MHEWFLESTSDADLSVCILLNEFREYTIGRRKGYDIVSLNPLVSRNHGVITVKPDGSVYVKDLKSANGTYINDQLIEPFKEMLLEKNDLLGIGAPSNAQEPEKEMYLVQCRLMKKIPPPEVISREADSINHDEYHRKNIFEDAEGESENLKKNVPTITTAQVPKVKKEKSSFIAASETSQSGAQFKESSCMVALKNVEEINVPTTVVEKVLKMRQEINSREDISSFKSVSESSQSSVQIENIEKVIMSTVTTAQVLEIKQENNSSEDTFLSVSSTSDQQIENIKKIIVPPITAGRVPEIKQEKNSCEDIFLSLSSVSAEQIENIEKVIVPPITAAQVREIKQEKISCKDFCLSISSTSDEQIENIEEISVSTITTAQVPEIKQEKNSYEDIFISATSARVAQIANIEKIIVPTSTTAQVPETKQEKNSCKDIFSIPSASTAQIEQPADVLKNTGSLQNDINNVAKQKNQGERTMQNLNKQSCAVDKGNKNIISSDKTIKDKNQNSKSDIKKFSNQDNREEGTNKENNLNTKSLLDKHNKNNNSNHTTTNATNFLKQDFDELPIKNSTVQENDSNKQSCLLNVTNKSLNSSLKNNIQENNLNIETCSVDNESSKITSKNNILTENHNDDLNICSGSSNENVRLRNLLTLLKKKRKESYRNFIICPSSDEENEGVLSISSDSISIKSDNKINNEVYAYENNDDVIFIEKPIKTESNNHSFTQNDFDDIIVVSDDDDDIFPKSQLFEIKEEPLDDDNSKTGDCTSPVSDITTDNDIIDKDNFGTVKNQVQEYDYSDNEEEDDNCIIWYNKLSQSLSSSQTYNEDPISKPSDDVDNDNFITFNDKDLDIFEEQAEELNVVEEQSKAKDVPELDDATDNRSIETTLSSIEEKEETSTKKKVDVKKFYTKPPVIDAPFLKKGKRKTTEETKSKESSPSISKRRKSSHDEVSSVSPDKSVKGELQKRYKKRRKSSETYTRDEKQKIQENRKKKLKELATKTAEIKEKKEEKKHNTKPKVKVSNGRGLFLAAVDPKPEVEKRKKTDTVLREEPPLKKPFKIPKKSDSVTSESFSSNAKKHKLSFSDLNVETGTKNITNLPSKEKGSIEKNTSISTNNNVTYKNNTLKGILKHPDRVTKSGNKVRFAEEDQIREIERLPGNIWRKVNSKDAPIPVINNTKNVDEVLGTVLGWQPMWLEQQKSFTDSPPGLTTRKLVQMTTKFQSFGDYFDTVTPLMLLELWKSIFRDWTEKNTPVNLACIENSVLRHDSLYLTCYCLTDRENSDTYPKRGDLLVAEFYLVGADANSKATNKKFGYVSNAYKRRMTPTDIVHRQFMGMGRAPQFKISFTMIINPLQIKILEEKLMRIRLVSNIPHMLRVYKAVSYLQQSPLRSLILTPNVQQYKITRPTQMTSATKDTLNNDQMMCVFEAYQICTRNEPGIYLIQGPPGTGKSYVIKNLVWQLLCDSNKNQNLQNLRILLCAPSNGAIDEITNTLLQMRSQMTENRFKMIRLGNPSSITKNKVKNISVQNLVHKHLAEQQNNALKTNVYLSEEYNFLSQKENTFKNKIVSLQERHLDSSFEVRKLKELQAKIERLKSNSNLYHERRKWERDTENTIIEKAQIICSTLSSCINSRFEEVVLEKKMQFTCCIIDEATQSDECNSLIPLILGIDKFVLVGDPEQLPPTIISTEAKTLGYGNSLFKRIQSCLEHLPDNPVRMLTEQYRMHPEICKFPSSYIYGGRLKTAEVMSTKIENILDPCRLFCLNGTEHYQGTEYINTFEAKFVLLLTDIVLKKTKYNVGIITPYSKQKTYLITKYKAMRTKENQDKEEDKDRHQRVVINTVDGFQGQERDVIIISTVRYQSNVFLNDIQRANVALTRAKHAVFICGHANLFKADSFWKQLEIDAKSRNFFYLITEKDSTDEKYISELILRK